VKDLSVILRRELTGVIDDTELLIYVRSNDNTIISIAAISPYTKINDVNLFILFCTRKNKQFKHVT